MTEQPHWKITPWEYREPYTVFVPGIGIFGGFEPDIAKHIVESVNAQQKISKAINDLMRGPGFVPHLEGL